jgi:hemerythrin
VLEFDPILLTGVEEIDGQHREIFARVWALLDAARHRRSREEVLPLVQYLCTYSVEHFAAEEREMARTTYPKAEAHRLEHAQFVKELDALRLELASDGPTALFAIRLGNRVTEWLREHIYRTDRVLGEWLRAHPR